MTIKNLYPKSRPQTIYNVINGRPELPAASTFSRASAASYIGSDGLVKFVGNDVPRVDHDYETGEVKGLLLEPAAINRIGFMWPANTNGSSNPSGTITLNTTDFAAPDGTFTANKCESIGGSRWSSGSVSDTESYTASCWVRTGPGESGSFNFRVFSGPTSPAFSVTDKWQRFSWTRGPGSGGSRFYPFNSVQGGATYYVWGFNLTYEANLSSLIKDTPREADTFSLTTTRNLDNGFSFLLDSNATTDDFIYKIKAGGSTIAELNNDNGTLDWVIDGTSAATSVPPQYPQVGAIQPGRVRTVSSFGAADGTTQQNYLYTEGLSFPTNAIVASGADEVEFGTEQTLKALYLWNGQLSNTEAVSVIKGEYTIVPNEPIKADSYSFVYDTDPTTVGETAITLPYIVPTVSMRVYWGDGTNSAYQQGVTPSHTYPYPGQYRIQIEADDGFDNVRLGDDISSVIRRVDQWASQHRVGATGDGFTGDDLYKILATQNECALIPPFKYTDLTDLNQAFWNCQKAAVNNWDWIPTNLQSATNLNSTFRTVSRLTMSTAERGTFPQLQTSTALTTVVECFRFNTFTQFDQGNSGLPFSNTQNVTNWSGCFRDLANLTAIGSLVTSAATNLSSTFNGCDNLAAMPFIATNNVTDFSSAWKDCSSLTSFPQINTSSGTNFYGAWYGCSDLTSFPQINTSSGTNFSNAWGGCSALTSFPQLDTSSGTNFSNAWDNCNNLTSFPLINTSSLESIGYAWYNCDSLDNIANAGETFSFPLLDFSQVTYASRAFYGCSSFTSLPVFDFSSMTNFGYAYFNCNSLTSIPATDFPVCTNFNYAFRGCSSITAFPSIDMQAGTTFVSSWQYDALLADFPANMFDTTGTLASNAFEEAWKNCALTAQSIENILVSLDTNGQSNIELGIDGGTNAGQSTWSAAANTAYTNLINKGWTITFNP